MLDNGTSINGKMIESPKSFQVACTITTQIIAAVASNQYGGQSVNVKHLGKYLAKSREKFKAQLDQEFGDTLDEESKHRIVELRLMDELKAGVQTIQYQINTLMTTNGQSPFVTLFLHIDDNDPYVEETVLIIKEILNQRIQGTKNEKGVYVTPAFPKLVYVLDENNCLKGGKYDDVTRLAAQCSAKRMYPDYISAKKMRENYEGNVFSCMGCRSFLSPWKDENGEYKWEGRSNQGVVSLNLPQIGILAKGDEEKFWKPNKVVGDIKLRAAWGQNGNSAIDNNYVAYSTYSYDIGNGAYDLNGTNTNTVSGIKVISTGNPKLKWETTTQTNIGLDAFLIDNTLSLTVDYYWKRTKDMITVPPVLKVAGENAERYMNTGEMKNHGFEANLNYHSPQYGKFSWEGNLNFSMYRNKLVKLNDEVSVIGGDFRFIEGQPLGVYYGYVCDGIFQNADQVSNHAIQEGKGVGRLIYRDIDGNGRVDENDRCIIGNPNPDFGMGLSLTFNYKNWSLSTFFSGEFGFDIYNGTRKQLEFMTYGNLYTNRSKDVLNAWTAENTGASIPALTTVDDNNEMRMSTYFVEDGSYMKCKYLKLSYRFDQPWLKKAGLSGMNAYAQVDNLFTITGYKGLDPEVPFGANWSRVDNGPYPRARTFSVGLNLTF